MSDALPTRPRTYDRESKISIVRSSYNEEFTQSMLDHSLKELEQIVPRGEVSVTETPGGFEVPIVVEQVLHTQKPDVVIAFGVIIRGETMHGDLIASSVTNALQEIAVRHKIPVIHEVLLVNDREQAYERCIGNELNRGKEAARAAQQMIRLVHSFQKYPKQ